MIHYIDELTAEDLKGKKVLLRCDLNVPLDEHGKPSEGLRSWSEILFPYDPSLAMNDDVGAQSISERNDLVTDTVETYSCDSDGIISVQISRGDGQSRTFEVFRA